MADLDRELLQLAGDDSSDDEQPQQTTVTTKEESASPRVPQLNDSTNGISSAKTNTATKAGGKKTTNRSKGDESEEEGEALSSSASGSAHELDSAPMSESDGDQSAGSGKSVATYQVDNLFKSEKEKAQIMALPEIQRETILAEREAALEHQAQNQRLRNLLKKRKAETAELEDVQRKSTRQKTTLGGRKVGETSDAMEAYKRQREQKGIIAEQRKTEAAERKARKGRGLASDGSEADADGESEIEWDDRKVHAGRRSESGPRDELPAEMKDYEHVRIGQTNFAQVCFYPGFEETVKGCYARICVGRDQGENVYRMALIKGISEGPPYALEGVNGKPFTTTQYCQTIIGKSERQWPFIFCSNGKFTVREYDRYLGEMRENAQVLPTKTSLIKKVDDINALVNHRFTEAEIQEKLKRSGVLARKFNSLERAQLNARRREAEIAGDAALLPKIDADILALDGPRLAFGTSLYKPVKKPEGKTQQQKLADLNKANRKANTRDVRKAQLAERKTEIAQRVAMERGEAVEMNHFARVKVRAKTHHDVNNPYSLAVPKRTQGDDLFSGSDGSRGATPVGDRKAPNGPAASSQEDEFTQPSGKDDGIVYTSLGFYDKKRGPWIIYGPSYHYDEQVLANLDLGIDMELFADLS